MKNNTAARRERLEFWVLLALLALLCAVPYLQAGLRPGDDGSFHLLRIEALAHEWRLGNLHPRIYTLLCGGYGYALGLFYPDLLLAPGALLRLLGVGQLRTYKLLFWASCLAAAPTAYAAGRSITGKHRAGLLLMLFYTLCQYHLGCLYIRNALGEVQAMAFVPLVLLGLYDLTERQGKKWWVLCIAFTGLLFTHTISLVLCGLFAAGWCLCRFPQLLQPGRMPRLLGAAALCLLLGACYWVPLLEQFSSDIFNVTFQPLTTLAENRLTMHQLLDPCFFVGLGIPGMVLLPATGLLLGAAWLRRRRGVGPAGRHTLPAVLWAVGGVLCLSPRLPAAFWQLLDHTPLHSMQFPWRVEGLGQMCLTFAAAALLAEWMEAHPHSFRWLAPVALAVCAAGAIAVWQRLPMHLDLAENSLFGVREQTFELGGGMEWLPAGADTGSILEELPAQYTSSAGVGQGRYLPDGSYVFAWDGTPGVFGIPKLYYKGYSARLEDGTPLPLHRDGGGRVVLDMPAGTSPGQVTVSYTGTTAQHLSDTVSALTVLAVALAVLCRRIKQFKRRPG